MTEAITLGLLNPLKSETIEKAAQSLDSVEAHGRRKFFKMCRMESADWFRSDTESINRKKRGNLTGGNPLE